MSEKNLNKVKRKKEERLGFNWFFWLSFVVLMIPVCYFLYLLYQASQESNVPILGDRIKDSIIYNIKDEDLSSINSQVTQLDGVEKVEVNLSVETLRILVDYDDTYTKDQYKQLCTDIYQIVDGQIPVATYFTRDGDFKQYDLEIIVYDNMELEDVRIATIYKTSNMESYKYQDYSEPIDSDLAYQLTHPQEDDVDANSAGNYWDGGGNE